MSDISKVELVWITPNAEPMIAEMARVSNPENAKNPSYAGLIKYLIKHKHWSPLEMASAVLSIHTNRRIAPQILRHRSFSFQEFSQRYAAVDGFMEVNPRRQDDKNRQSSHDDLSDETKIWFRENMRDLQDKSMEFYQDGLARGISKESMAFALMPTAKTHIYMSGTIRSWTHYIDLRSDPATQLEHREIALAAKDIFIEHLPNIAEAMGWKANG